MFTATMSACPATWINVVNVMLNKKKKQVPKDYIELNISLELKNKQTK